ncbi:MAG: biotin synthase BioB [Methanosphaera stadtmanae]|nr:biotin synthase BioB [Methanosphaera stadtmanae]
MNITSLKNKIINGHDITREEALSLINVPLKELCQSADEIRQHFCGNTFDACTIINVKSGECSENCVFCAQSVYYDTKIQKYSLMNKNKLIKETLNLYNHGFKRISYVSSGRKISSEEFNEILETIIELKKIKKDINICVSLGFLSSNEINKLKDVGVSRIHCNLECSKKYFPHVCSTHSYTDKLETIKKINENNILTCSGGIFGLGESFEDRIELALTLRDLNIQSIPINVLNPIPGTPVGDNIVLDNDEVCRIIAIFRFINPSSFIRMAGGRSLLVDHGKNAFMSGSNSAILGNMLTTLGVSFNEDLDMIRKLGFHICYDIEK